MKNVLKISLMFSFVLATIANAQVVTKTDTISGTPLTISMDGKISNLLDKSDDNCNRVTTGGTKVYTNNDNNDDDAPSKPNVSVPSKPLSNAEICKRNPRLMGYKIQLTTVKSNEEANEVKAYFRRRFPHIKAETDASLRPNYKVLVGSYFTKESASSDLKKIREFFKSAVSVQYRIFCVEAK